MSDNSGVHRCPPCQHGKHRQHQYDYKDKQGVLHVCRCKACNPEKKAK